jgi:hypothetical protein
MRSGCFFFLCFFFSALFFNTSLAQDSAAIRSSASYAIDFYSKYIGANSHLYTGSEYIPYNSRTTSGHPWFESNFLEPGFINYEEVLYNKVNIAYDIVHDEVTINRYNENFRIKLASEKIACFFFLNHFFVRLVQDSTNKSVIATGFYEQLYNGKLKLFAKRIKKAKDQIVTDEGGKIWFEEHNLYYVQKNNKYYSVQSKVLLFDVLKDRKSEVQKYLRKNKIKFRKSPELTVLKAVEYYDQLKN